MSWGLTKTRPKSGGSLPLYNLVGTVEKIAFLWVGLGNCHSTHLN